MSKLQNYLKIAVNSITHRKIRSWLTVIGIVIGVAAIVSLISMSNGMEHAINEQFEEFGIDTINVIPKDFRGPGTGSPIISDEDVDVINRMTEFEYVLPMVYGAAEIEFHDEKAFSYVMGVETSGDVQKIWEKAGFEAESGRFPEKGESNVVGLGHIAAYDMFEEEVHVKNRILINGKKFKVVGIAKEVGNQQDDSSIYMSIDNAKEVLDQEDYSFIMLIAKPGVDVDEAANEVERRLKNARNDENIQVLTFKEVMEQIKGILAIIQLVLVGIAGISLIVGAIGIMNTMYTSVLERTKEIGIMKAIGASNESIMLIFLIESSLLGIVGGVIGAVIGTAIAQGVGLASAQFALPFPLKIIIEWKLIGFSIAFAAIVGGLSGFMPARKAAKMNPVDSLRYE